MARTVKHFLLAGFTLLFSLFFTVLTLPLGLAEATTWEPEPAPKTLTPAQKVYYPDLDTYSTTRVRNPLLVVLTSNLSWQDISKNFKKYPQLMKYAAAGSVGNLAAPGCLSESVLTIQNGTASSAWNPCPQAEVAGGKIAGMPAEYWRGPKEASPGQLAGILEAFGIKARAIGPQAGLLLASPKGEVKDYKALPASARRLTTQVKAGMDAGGLTVVDLTSLANPEQQLAMLEGALAGLTPQSDLISLSLVAGSGNSAPQVLSYSPSEATGLATSASTNVTGLATLADINAQILFRFALPVPDKNHGAALTTSSLPDQIQPLINLNNAATNSAQQNLQLRLDYLQNQADRSSSSSYAKTWFYLAIFCCFFFTLGGYLWWRMRAPQKRRRSGLALSAAGVFTALLFPASFCPYLLAGADWSASAAWISGAIILIALTLSALLALLVFALRQSFAFPPALSARAAGIAASALTLGILLFARQDADYAQLGSPLGYNVLAGPFFWQLSAEATSLALSCVALAAICILASFSSLRAFWHKHLLKCRVITVVAAATLFTCIYLWAGLSALLCGLLFLAPLTVALRAYGLIVPDPNSVSRPRSGFRAVSVAAVLGAVALAGAGIIGIWGVNPDAPAAKIASLPKSADTKVAVIFTSGLSWEDLVAAQPQLVKNSPGVKSGTLFSLAPYPLKAMACPQDAWLAFSAGKAPSRYSLAGRNLCLQPEALDEDERVKMWEYYQRAAEASSLAARLGGFADQLRQNQISAGAIGNSAALALADEDGVIRGQVDDTTPLATGYAQAVHKMVSTHTLTLIDAQAAPQNLNPERQTQEILAQREDLFNFLDPSSGKSQLKKTQIWDPVWLLQNGGSLSGNSLQAGTLVSDSANPSPQESDRNRLRREEMTPQENPTPPTTPGSFGDSDQPFSPEDLHLLELSTVLSPDEKVDHEYLAQTRKQNARLFPTVSTYPDLRGMQPARITLAQQEKQIHALENTLAALPEGTRALVVSASPDSALQRLQAAMIYGKGITAGIAYSPSTHQVGIAQTADLPATVLDWLGARDEKLSTSGSPLMISANDAQSATDRLERLAGTSQRADASYARLGLTPSSFVTFAAGALLVLALSLVVLLQLKPSARRPHLRTQLGLLGQFLCLGVAALPAACLGAAMLPWWESESPTAFFITSSILIASLLALVACTGPWRRRPIGPALVVAAFSAFFICLDVATGSHISMDSPFGSFSLLGARFFGFGNVYYSVCAIWTLLLCGCLTPLAKRAVFGKKALTRSQIWLSNLLIALLGMAFMVIDGLPRFGADFGGPISFLPGFLILVLLLNGKRIGLKRIALVLLVAGGASVSLAIADWMRPASQRTHLGNFVQSVLNGDLQVILTRKIFANLASWGSTTYVWSLLCCLLVFCLLVIPALSKTVIPTNLFLPDNLASPLLINPYPHREGKQNYWLRVRAYLANLGAFATSLLLRIRPRLGETPLAEKESTLRITLLAIGINQLFAYLLNDSGTQLPATGLLLTALAYCSAVFASLPGASRGTAR